MCESLDLSDQVEDDHPAVSAAALHCLANVAPQMAPPADSGGWRWVVMPWELDVEVEKWWV